jgi:hypothetical protein
MGEVECSSFVLDILVPSPGVPAILITVLSPWMGEMGDAPGTHGVHLDDDVGIASSECW